MSLPQTGADEWEGPVDSPWLVVNPALRKLDAFATRTVVESRVLTEPPAACSDGQRWLVGDAPGGAWALKDGKLAIAYGDNASNGWVFANVANEGSEIYVKDEALLIEYLGGQWIVSPDRVRHLNDIADVDLTGLNDGDTLYWDQSNGQFYPGSPNAPPLSTIHLSDIEDVDLTGLADGAVLRYDLSNGVWYVSFDANALEFTACRLRKAANLTAQNVTAALTAVTWNTEIFDTHELHDSVSNTDRITPLQSGYWEFEGLIELANISTGNWVRAQIHRFDSGGALVEILGASTMEVSATGTFQISVSSGPCRMEFGEYAKLMLQVETDSLVDITTTSRFSGRRIA